MNVQKRNGVLIYCLSSGPSLPEWLSERGRRNLSKKDEAIRRRIELIQDFQMPASSSRLVQSMDGRYIMVAGTYPPRIRCFDLHELTMKFERYVNAEVIDLVMLGEDYGKLALLQEDRTVCFHAHYGAHESIRIPTFGRAMAYESTTCELLIAAKGSRIFRINLEEGRHSEPWKFDPSSSSSSSSDVSATCISVNPAYPVAAVGCENGMVRFWDNRSPDTLKPMIKLDVKSATQGYGYALADAHGDIDEISAVTHDPTGMFLAAGTTGGLVALYDVRSSKPLYVQEHKHGLPINTIRFHSTSGLILSSDEKLIKAWRYKSNADLSSSRGNNMLAKMEEAAAEPAGRGGDSNSLGSLRANIECSGKLSHFIVAGDEADPRGEKSGILLCTTDQPKMESYYLPSLGVAPKWCSFLENITEELAERDLSRTGSSGDTLVQAGEEAVYENYKFVSRDDLDQLGIAHLVGTPLLRGYMHGFFMDINLYNRVKAVANPFEYEEYRKKKIKERLEAKRASRIAVKESHGAAIIKTAVNPELAERLQTKASDSTKAGKAAGQVLTDDRFGSLFTNPDYQIDEEDENFKLRNPSGVAAVRKKKENLDSDDDDDDEQDDESDDNDIAPGVTRQEIDDEAEAEEETSHDGGEKSSNDSDSDDDGFRGGKVRGEAYQAMMKSRKEPKQKKSKKPIAIMKEADSLAVMGAAKTTDLVIMGAAGTGRPAQEPAVAEKNLPLSKRLALQAEQEEPNADILVQYGSKELRYIPRGAKRPNDRDEQRGGTRKRRGVKELRLKRGPA